MKINLANINLPKDISFDEINGNLVIQQKNETYNKIEQFFILIALFSFLAMIVFLFTKNILITVIIMSIIIVVLIFNLSKEESIKIIIKDGILLKEERDETTIKFGVKKDEENTIRNIHLIETKKIVSLSIMKYEKKYFLNLIDIDNNHKFITSDRKEENILTIKKILDSYI